MVVPIAGTVTGDGSALVPWQTLLLLMATLIERAGNVVEQRHVLGGDGGDGLQGTVQDVGALLAVLLGCRPARGHKELATLPTGLDGRFAVSVVGEHCVTTHRCGTTVQEVKPAARGLLPDGQLLP